jgi:hypothetical protein
VASAPPSARSINVVFAARDVAQYGIDGFEQAWAGMGVGRSCSESVRVRAQHRSFRLGRSLEASESLKEQRQPGLAAGVARQMARQGRHERLVREQIRQPITHVLAHFRRTAMDFVDQLRAPIDDGDDVLKIVTRQEISVPAVAECIELRRQKERRGHEADRTARWQIESCRGCDREWLPSVVESEDVRPRGKQVELQTGGLPPADQ